ncbi:MAG: type II toxin-antitoxin system RnlA family toxin, partial [Trichococcus flocculiformis]
SLTLSGIESGELELVLEVIQEEVDGIKYYNNSQENCLSHTLVSNNDKVVINSYNSGKITIQGKQSSFKEYVIILLVQLCEGEQEVIEVLNGYHEVKMDSDDIDKLFNQLMPNYVRGQKKLSKLDNVLYKAVYNYNLKDDQIRDYSDLPMPMLRALEYYLHTTFKSVSLLTVNSRDVNQFGCYFEKW